MDYGFFEYICDYWDEKMVTARGVVYASTFADAVDKIEKYYDHIDNIQLQSLEPSSVYDFENDSIIFSSIFNGEEENG